MMRPIANKKIGKSACAHNGFTLIEILVVAVIIGIFAAIAVPSYRYAITKAKRAEGTAALMELMQQQERYYSQNTTYVEFTSASTALDEKKFKWYSGETASNSAYELSAGKCADESIQSCIKLTAEPGTPKVNSSFTDKECGNLTFTSTGVKSADAKNCW
jgi:type IV pilus assembly protein PilE